MAQNKRRKGSNWSSSADVACLPAFQKSNSKNLRTHGFLKKNAVSAIYKPKTKKIEQEKWLFQYGVHFRKRRGRGENEQARLVQ